MDREAKLRRLAAAQSRDDQTVRLRRRDREVRATDLHRHRGRVEGPTDGERLLSGAESRGMEPWQIAAAREGDATLVVERASVLIGFTPTWDAEVVSYDPRDGAPCPGCGGVELRRGEVCVVCHATRARPKPTPMRTRTEGASPRRLTRAARRAKMFTDTDARPPARTPGPLPTRERPSSVSPSAGRSFVIEAETCL